MPHMDPHESDDRNGFGARPKNYYASEEEEARQTGNGAYRRNRFGVHLYYRRHPHVFLPVSLEAKAGSTKRIRRRFKKSDGCRERGFEIEGKEQIQIQVEAVVQSEINDQVQIQNDVDQVEKSGDG